MRTIFGFIYVITTKQYEAQSIYKIGCTKNLENRLKTLNSTRLKGDKFYVRLHIRSFEYFKIETLLHNKLHHYKIHNEFYRCSVDTISNVLSTFSWREFIYDLVYIFAYENKICWDDSKQCFYYDNFTTDVNTIIENLQKFMANYDRYNLNKYIFHKTYSEYIEFIKCIFNRERDITDLEDILGLLQIT